jgi:peptidyl-prolyl cis-trans isomerase SurA
MNRHVVAGVLGLALALALAGCAQDRSSLSGSNPAVGPVDGSTPVPSIYEAINRENPNVDVDSVRSGHVTESSARRDQARLAKQDAGANGAAGEGSSARREEASGSLVSRLSGRWSGSPWPRTRTVPPVVAEAEATLGAAGGTQAAAEGTPPEPEDPASPSAVADVGMPAPIEASGTAQTDGAVPVAAAMTGEASPAPPSESPGAAGPWPDAPTAATQPDGRVKIAIPPDSTLGGEAVPSLSRLTDPPGPMVVPGPLAPGISATASGGDTLAPQTPAINGTLAPQGVDPLLGPNPDVMPTVDLALPPGQAGSPPPATPPGGAGGGLPAPVEDPGPPPPAAATATPPAQPAAPPAQPAAAAAPASEPAPGGANVPTAARLGEPPANAGLPPLVGEMETNRPEPAVNAPPIGASPPSALIPTIPVETPPDSAAAAAAPAAVPAGPPTVPVTPDQAPSTPTAATGAAAEPASAALPIPTPTPTPAPAPPAGDPTAAAETAPVLLPLDGAPGQPAPAANRAAPDPLLGPNPDIMPLIELPPPAEGPAGPAVTPEPAPSPEPAAPAEDSGASASGTAARLEGGDRPLELPLLTKTNASPVSASAPASSSAAATDRSHGGEASGFASVPVSAAAEKTRDPEVRRAGAATETATAATADPSRPQSDDGPRSVFAASKPYARVGDEVITYREVRTAYNKRRQSLPADVQLTPEDQYRLVRSVLDELIDRAVLLQEARRELKKPQQYKMVMDMADKYFDEHELPPLMRRTASTNVHELKAKLKERNESLEEIREQFRREFLSQGFLEQKIGPRLKVGLPEMREYYQAHVHDFDRPAQVTWREVLIEVDRSKSRTEARARADALLARLRRGEDFAAVARAASDGPNKGDGGLWQTSPGSYGVAAVNAALETLAAGQISPVIEGPTSFHIVRVESRRRAGPASFAEVQDRIQNTLKQQLVQRESTGYLERLRRGTFITTVFDSPGAFQTSAQRTSTRR